MHGSIIIGGYSMSCVDCIYFRAGVLQDYCVFWDKFCVNHFPCFKWYRRSSLYSQVNKSVDKEDAV